MDYLFLIILIGALGAGLVVLTWMGLAQQCRRRLLARAAREMGLKFSSSDPFDVTARYSGCVLVPAGHSRRAENVLYGTCDGWRLKAFDFSYEAGHGPRRLARRYSVIIAETDRDLPDSLLWHAADHDHPPLAARGAVGRQGVWRVVNGADMAPRLAQAFHAFAEEPLNIQTLGRSVILALADQWKPGQLPDRLRRTVAGLEALQSAGEAG